MELPVVSESATSPRPEHKRETIEALKLIQAHPAEFTFPEIRNQGLISCIQLMDLSGGTMIKPENISAFYEPVWASFLDSVGVGYDVRTVVLSGLLKNTPFFFDVKEKSSNQFRLLQAEEAKVLVSGELGHDTMVDTGGVHVQRIDATECKLTNGQIHKITVATSLLALAHNQTVYSPKDSKISKQIIDEIKENGWGKYVKRDTTFLDDHVREVAVQGKDFPKNIMRKRVRDGIVTDRSQIAGRHFDAVQVRVFSDGGSKFCDIPVVKYLALPEKDADEMLISSKRFNEGYAWHNVEKIDTSSFEADAPLVAISRTVWLATPDSLVHKYLCSRGRNAFHFNIVDDPRYGRLIESANGHVRVNGNEATIINDDVASKVGVDKVPGKRKFKFPKIINNPEIPSINSTEIMREFGLTDQEFLISIDSERLDKAISTINDILVSKYSQETLNRAAALGASTATAKEVRNILNAQYGRHILFSQVMEWVTGSSVYVALTKPQTEKELGMGLVKMFPNQIRRKISDTLLDFNKKTEISQNDIDKNIQGIVDSIYTSLGLQSSTRVGFSPLGFLQGFVNKSRELAEKATDFIRPMLNKKVHPTQMISDLGQSRKAENFRTAQNQNAWLSRFYGFINNTLIARINNSEPHHFESINFKNKIDPAEAGLFFGDLPNKNSRIQNMYDAQAAWNNRLTFWPKSNQKKLETFWIAVENSKLSKTEQDDLKQGLRDYVTICNYIQTKKATILMVELAEKIADALQRKYKVTLPSG